MRLFGNILLAGFFCAFSAGQASPVVVLPSCSSATCDFIQGWGATTITAGAVAAGVSGADTVTLIATGYTDGPVRPGFIQLAGLNSIVTSGRATGFVNVTVGGFQCSSTSDVAPCNLWGQYDPASYLPFTLGTDFMIRITASFSVAGPNSSGAASSAVAFTLFDSFLLPGGTIAMPGAAVPVLAPPATPASAPVPELGTMLLSAPLLLVPLLRRFQNGV